jgi:hypothetical protein
MAVLLNIDTENMNSVIFKTLLNINLISQVWHIWMLIENYMYLEKN